jgi:hypothetical protein
MLPKKVMQGAAAAKPTKRNAALSKKSAPPIKSAKKRPLMPEEIPYYDRNVTTQASRDRKRFKLSRASIYQDVEVQSITALAQKLQGESIYSWGVPEVEPIEGSRKKKTRSRGTKRNSIEEAYLQLLENMQPSRAPVIPNNPEHTPILRISLEIREKIYLYLLTYPKPIMVKEDWKIVERNPFQSHAIIQTCKQFAEEGTRYLYKFNTFQAVLRNPSTIFRRRDDPVEINPKFHPLLRNIVIDCSIHCWNLEWYDKVAAGLQKLVEAKSVIQSLTLVLVPRRVGMSTTTLGIEYNPVTFADFLWYNGALMTAIRNLAPRTLNVVVKKSDNKRLLMAIDLTYLQAGSEETLLTNMESIKLAQAKAGMVNEELLKLKERFDDIFEDDGWALQEGKCRLLSVGERVPGNCKEDGVEPSAIEPQGERSCASCFQRGQVCVAN